MTLWRIISAIVVWMLIRVLEYLDIIYSNDNINHSSPSIYLQYLNHNLHQYQRPWNIRPFTFPNKKTFPPQKKKNIKIIVHPKILTVSNHVNRPVHWISRGPPCWWLFWAKLDPHSSRSARYDRWRNLAVDLVSERNAGQIGEVWRFTFVVLWCDMRFCDWYV